MIEEIIRRLSESNKPKDVYYVRRLYSFNGIVDLKNCKNDYQLSLIQFQDLVRTFDIGYTGHVILFKNKLEKEILRVNL